MPFDVVAHEWADGDHPQATSPRVLEGEPSQLIGDASPAKGLQDLGVDQRETPPLDDVVEEPGELVLNSRLVSMLGFDVGDRGFHEPDGRSSSALAGDLPFGPSGRLDESDVSWRPAQLVEDTPVLEGLSPVHLIAVLVVALLILGPGRLPETGKALGTALRNFRAGLRGDDRRD